MADAQARLAVRDRLAAAHGMAQTSSAACVGRASEGVKFLGWQENAQRFFKDADVCAVPSLWNEPYGTVGAEALSHGVPVVTFDVGGLSGWLIPGETGLFAKAPNGQTRVPEARTPATLAAACVLSLACAGLCLAADEGKSLRALIVSKDVQWRNPTTEIHVDFGDVRHLSPWRIKWRIPRGSGARGGQLVTLRDAMLAINEEVARDEEMPEHTFAFAADGSLSSICDIPVSSSANGTQQ